MFRHGVFLSLLSRLHWYATLKTKHYYNSYPTTVFAKVMGGLLLMVILARCVQHDKLLTV